MKKQKGFSLLEILIAMAVMAIMVAVAFPNLGKDSDKLAKQEVLRLVAAIELIRDQSIILNKEYGLNIDEKGYQFLVLNETDEESGKSFGKGSSESKESGKSEQSKGSSGSSDSKGSKGSSSERSEPRWQLIEDVPGLAAHEFPEGLDVNLTIDGDNVFSSSDDEIEIFEEEIDIFEDEDEQEKVDPPQIYFLSSGEQNQFSIGIAVAEVDQRDNEEIRFYRVRGFLTGNLKYEGPLVGNLFQDLDREFERNY